jgi:hypothetical protein
MIPNLWARNQAGIHREATHMSYSQHVGTGKHGPIFAPNAEICHSMNRFEPTASTRAHGFFMDVSMPNNLDGSKSQMVKCPM